MATGSVRRVGSQGPSGVPPGVPIVRTRAPMRGSNTWTDLVLPLRTYRSPSRSNASARGWGAWSGPITVCICTGFSCVSTPAILTIPCVHAAYSTPEPSKASGPGCGSARCFSTLAESAGPCGSATTVIRWLSRRGSGGSPPSGWNATSDSNPPEEGAPREGASTIRMRSARTSSTWPRSKWITRCACQLIFMSLSFWVCR